MVQIFKTFGCAKIRNDSKRTKTNRNQVMQPTTLNSDSWLSFSYNVHSQAGFDNPFTNEKALFTWVFRRRVSLFKYLQEFKVAY